MTYAQASYKLSPEILEWMNHTLFPVEDYIFRFYRTIGRLVRLVDRAEAGEISKYAANSAIRSHNQKNRTSVTYEEILERGDMTEYLFTGIGEWAAYVDSPKAGNSIITGDYDDPIEAFDNADPDVNWIVLWLVQKGEVVVCRSPFVGRRAEEEDSALTNGVERGDVASYVLPPEVEASIGWGSADEIMNNHTQQERRADVR